MADEDRFTAEEPEPPREWPRGEIPDLKLPPRATAEALIFKGLLCLSVPVTLLSFFSVWSSQFIMPEYRFYWRDMTNLIFEVGMLGLG